MSEQAVVTEVLMTHQIHYERRAWPSYECSCGRWDGAEGTDGGRLEDVDNDNEEAAAAHVAAAVVEALTQPPTSELTPDAQTGTHA